MWPVTVSDDGQSGAWADMEALGEAPTDPCAGDLGEPPASGTSPSLEPDHLMLQLDEASAAGSLSLHAAMRYFERHRTTYLGGPAGLQSLADAGVNVVVARLNKLQLLPAASAVRV